MSVKYTENLANISPAELERQYKLHNPAGHFFDDDTLKFFGERRSNYRILTYTAIVEGKECYVLSSLQKNPVMGSRRVRHYFSVENFENVVVI